MPTEQHSHGKTVAAAFMATAAVFHGTGKAAAFLSAPAASSLRGSEVASSSQLASQPQIAAGSPTSSSMVAGAAAVSAAVAVSAGVHRRRRVARAAYNAERFVAPEEWCNRVKRIEGDRALFEVTIKKPLGLVPANFPNRPGVGVAKITPEGNTDTLNRSVWLDGAPGMWVLEGDEVVAINGESVEGATLDIVGPLVKDAPGDSVTLQLVRYYKAGPVKVLFFPSEKVATMRRGSEIQSAAKVGVEEVSYSCEEGWCKSCWQTDPMWGVTYRSCSAVSKKRAPPKNPRVIPEAWDNVMPMYLLSYPEARQWYRDKKEKEKDENQKEMASA